VIISENVKIFAAYTIYLAGGGDQPFQRVINLHIKMQKYAEICTKSVKTYKKRQSEVTKKIP